MVFDCESFGAVRNFLTLVVWHFDCDLVVPIVIDMDECLSIAWGFSICLAFSLDLRSNLGVSLYLGLRLVGGINNSSGLGRGSRDCFGFVFALHLSL